VPALERRAGIGITGGADTDRAAARRVRYAHIFSLAVPNSGTTGYGPGSACGLGRAGLSQAGSLDFE
jgi:hypothetical protein